jgi:hypothetical protein
MPNGSVVWSIVIAPRQQLWTRVLVVLPHRGRRIEIVAAAGLWHNLFNKLDDSPT